MISPQAARPIAIYYEHPRWFQRLFAELDRRGAPYLPVDAAASFYSPDPTLDALPNSGPPGVVFNRMSPSAYHRGHGDCVLYTLSHLAHLEMTGHRVINGEKAFRYEISKALQLSLLQSLGLPYPKSRVIHRPQDALAASVGLRYPVVVKPNIGGSGVGVVKFDTPEMLIGAIESQSFELGPDHTGLVQEFVPARDGYIVRVEGLEGRFLYAIKVYTTGETFDLCPADICQTARGVALENACPLDGPGMQRAVEGAPAPKAGLRVEGYRPPDDVIRAVETIFRETGIEVGGIEYMIDDRDGQIVYYDINALSNFVADAPKVIGFDPFVNLVDFLLREAANG